MILGGEHDGDLDRYCSRDDAMAGHAQVVERLETAVCSLLGARWQRRVRRLLAVIARRDRNDAIRRFEAWLLRRGALRPAPLPY